jgi:transcriptional regulator with GAF, ATPase, and Fis domain
LTTPAVHPPFAQSARATDKFLLLLELSRAFSAMVELDELLPLVLGRTKDVLDGEACSIMLLDEKTQELYFPVTSDMSPDLEERLRRIRFPADRGISGSVLHSGRAELVEQVVQDPRFYPAVDEEMGVHTRDLLCAPLRTHQGVIGVIGVRNKREGGFTIEDLEFLDALAGSIAIAIDNARLYEQVRQSEARLQAEVAVLRRERVQHERFAEIIGTSPAMQRVFSLIETAIPTPISVLLEGETGAGKELIARAIHSRGARGAEPFVAVNCGALPESLLESELFGFRRGSFTGAMTDKVGLFEAADGGTVFLDEIGETSLATQVSLLRVLQEGEIRRLGDTRPRKIDVRLICATNRDLMQEVRERRFREDLYYRISVFPIRIPPLRERREDIPLLVSRLLEQSSRRLGKPVRGIDRTALDKLVAYNWPGNVRELQNEIERAVALAPAGSDVTVDQLSERVLRPATVSINVPATESSLRQARQSFERDYVIEVLRQHGNNATQAAQALHISRQMLHRKLKELGIR